MGYPHETMAAVEAAISKKGFGFVEILAPCPTGFGKANDQREAKDAWDAYKEQTITRVDLASLSAEERAANTKTIIGTLWEADKPEYSRRWQELVARLQAEE